MEQHNDPEILELIDRLDQIDEEIARLILRNDVYIEMKNKLKHKVLDKLHNLADRCTHKLPDGSYATSLGIKEKWVWGADSMRKQATCDLCKGIFYTQEVKDVEDSVAKKIAEDKVMIREWREADLQNGELLETYHPDPAPDVETVLPENEIPFLDFNPAINVFENPNLAKKVRLHQRQY